MIALPKLPPEISAIVDPASAEEIFGGKSKSRVFRFPAGFFLKITDSAYVANELEQEQRVLGWLAQQDLPAPRAIALARTAGKTFFLMSEIPGRSLQVGSLDAKATLEQSAHFLARLHSLQGGPVHRPLAIIRKLARENWNKGLVDNTDFDPDHQGMDPERMLQELDREIEEDLVFTHGDYCLANILADKEHITGAVDWGRAGVADRYQDIAIFLRSYRSKFGVPDEALFLEHYGLIDELDRHKLAFFRKLDEFF